MVWNISFPLCKLDEKKKKCLKWYEQRAKKVVPDSPGLVDFAIRLVNSVLKLHDGQVKFFEEFKLQKKINVKSILLIKMSLGLVEMMFELVYAIFSLPEWQA